MPRNTGTCRAHKSGTGIKKGQVARRVIKSAKCGAPDAAAARCEASSAAHALDALDAGACVACALAWLRALCCAMLRSESDKLAAVARAQVRPMVSRPQRSKPRAMSSLTTTSSRLNRSSPVWWAESTSCLAQLMKMHTTNCKGLHWTTTR